MATAPRYNTQVAPGNVPTVQYGQVDNQLADLGRGMQQLGAGINKYHDEASQTQAREAANLRDAELSQLKLQYAQQQGKNAVMTQVEYTNKINEINAKHRSSVEGNSTALKYYTQTEIPAISATKLAIDNHAAAEDDAFKKQTAEASKVGFTKNILSLGIPDTPEKQKVAQENFVAAESVFNDEGKRLGKDEKTIAVEKAAWKSTTRKSVVDNLLDTNNADKAFSYYTSHKNDIDLSAQAELEKRFLAVAAQKEDDKVSDFAINNSTKIYDQQTGIMNRQLAMQLVRDGVASGQIPKGKQAEAYKSLLDYGEDVRKTQDERYKAGTESIIKMITPVDGSSIDRARLTLITKSEAYLSLPVHKQQEVKAAINKINDGDVPDDILVGDYLSIASPDKARAVLDNPVLLRAETGKKYLEVRKHLEGVVKESTSASGFATTMNQAENMLKGYVKAYTPPRGVSYFSGDKPTAEGARAIYALSKAASGQLSKDGTPQPQYLTNYEDIKAVLEAADKAYIEPETPILSPVVGEVSQQNWQANLAALSSGDETAAATLRGQLQRVIEPKVEPMVKEALSAYTARANLGSIDKQIEAAKLEGFTGNQVYARIMDKADTAIAQMKAQEPPGAFMRTVSSVYQAPGEAADLAVGAFNQTAAALDAGARAAGRVVLDMSKDIPAALMQMYRDIGALGTPPSVLEDQKRRASEDARRRNQR